MKKRSKSSSGAGPLRISTGKVAKQANGAMWVRYGESVVLVTAQMDKNGREGLDFLPSRWTTGEYTYAAGRFPRRLFQARGASRRTLRSWSAA